MQHHWLIKVCNAVKRKSIVNALFLVTTTKLIIQMLMSQPSSVQTYVMLIMAYYLAIKMSQINGH